MSWFPKTPLLNQKPHNDNPEDTSKTSRRKCCDWCCSAQICAVLPIFHPFGKFRMIWDPILILVLIVSSMEIPFTLSFSIILSLDNWAGILALLFDLFLCVDILINFRTAYFDEFDPLQLITSPQHIAKKYLKTRFVFDFLTSFPFEFMPGTTTDDVADYLKIFRVLRIIRLLKLVRILRMMKLFDILPKKLSISPEYIIYIKILKVFFGMVLGAHYFACIWWATGKGMINNGYDSWILQLEHFDINVIDDDVDIPAKYSYSYYWSIVTLYTTGFGDLTAQNVVEAWVSVFCVVIGTVYISYLIGLIAAFVTEGDRIKLIENERLKNALIFCEHYNVSDKLSHAVESHLRYHHSYNYVICDAEQEVLQYLPKHLRKQIETEIACKTLKDIDFLNEYLPLHLIGQIAIKMKSISCNANHWLYKKNDIGDEIYIQRTGVSMIYYQHNNNNFKTDRISRGDVIGENCLIFKKRNHSIKCFTWSEFYCFDKNDLINIIKNNFVNPDKIINKIKNKIKNSNNKIRRNIYRKRQENVSETSVSVNNKNIIHELSNQGQDIKKTFILPQRNENDNNITNNMQYDSLVAVMSLDNSMDLDIISSTSRSRLNSDNRNKKVLDHFRYIHLPTKHNKHDDNVTIEAEESLNDSTNSDSISNTNHDKNNEYQPISDTKPQFNNDNNVWSH